MTQARLSLRGERWLMTTLAGVRFTHILGFMIMLPLGPQQTRLLGTSDAPLRFRPCCCSPASPPSSCRPVSA